MYKEAEPPTAKHYCQAVKAGNLLFISGASGRDGSGQLVGRGDVIRQADQAFNNLEAILARVGADLSHIVKLTVFLRDIGDWEKLNPLREKRFGAHPPASTLVQVSRLVGEDWLIEVEAIAVLDSEEGGIF